MKDDSAIKRCLWATQYDIYLRYHDEEWGIPCYNAQQLFTMLNLELMQAGLSWRLILEKRSTLEKKFTSFDPKKLAKFSEEKIEKLMQDPSIIRNRAKINAVIQNAKQFLVLEKQGIDFVELVWSVVNGTPIINQWKKHEEIPTKTKEADALTQLLKKHGFKFLGPTIIYSFMQAVGLVNDHLVDCFRHVTK